MKKLIEFWHQITGSKSKPAATSQLREPWRWGALDELYCSYTPCYEKAGQIIIANSRQSGSCDGCGRFVTYGQGAGLSFRDGRPVLICTDCADKTRKRNRKIKNCAICGKAY